MKSILLLSNSIKDNLYFQTLAFNSNKKLGDFKGSTNYKNEDDLNQTIQFRLPLALDYFDGEYFIELKYQNEEKGLKTTGDYQV
jgi:hypothetical protein